jgi:hypothetical protein
VIALIISIGSTFLFLSTLAKLKMDKTYDFLSFLHRGLPILATKGVPQNYVRQAFGLGSGIHKHVRQFLKQVIISICEISVADAPPLCK